MPLELALTRHAARDGATAPPLVIAHGLFGAGRNFATMARRLAVRRDVIAVDLRNHGDSPWDAAMDYAAMAADLGHLIRREAGGRAALLGHSMGGKAAMVLALTAPELVAGLIVADIAPVAYAHAHGGYLAAMRGLDLAAITRRSQADAALAGAIPDPGLRGFIVANLSVEDSGARWRLNLDALTAGMPDILGFPQGLHAFSGPALFLHGGRSDYVAPKHHGAVRALFPRAEIVAIPDAGHWLHAEAPDAFATAVAGWLGD